MSQRTRAAKTAGAPKSDRAETDADAEQRDSTTEGDPPVKAPRATSQRKSRSPRAVAASPAPGSAPTPESAPAPSGMSGTDLVRVLRAVAGELERDPALARRVAEAMRGERALSEAADKGRASHTAPASAPAPATDDDDSRTEPVQIGRSFRPRIITGAAVDLGAGVPDPFALRERLGADGLRAALDELRLGTLRAIIREHALDPTGRLKSQNDAEKLRAAILKATAKGR